MDNFVMRNNENPNSDDVDSWWKSGKNETAET